MSELYELPNGWEWHRLDEVSTFNNGRAYKKEELLEDGKYRVLRVGNFFTNNNWYYSDLELEDNKYCDKGDLLYAWSASFGPKIWNEDKVIYHYHIWKVVPNYDLIGRDYLFHFLNWDTDKIKSDKGSGATMIHITKGSIEERKIPLPPLTEQQRIVEKLDQLFEKIDKAIALHQKNIDEADAFMGSSLNEVFGELEEKYDSKTFGEISSDVRYGYTAKAKDSGNALFIRITDIGENGKFKDDFVYVDIEEKDLSRFKLQNGDILVARSGATAGKVALFDLQHCSVFASYLIRIQPTERIQSPFLFYFCHSPNYWKQLNEIKVGGAQPNVNATNLKEIKISLPPLPIQQKVVTYLDDLSDKIERVKTVQKEKMDSLKALKASILDKAFRGEL